MIYLSLTSQLPGIICHMASHSDTSEHHTLP